MKLTGNSITIAIMMVMMMTLPAPREADWP